MNWEQIKAILWLRWRLSANRLVRGGPLNTVLSLLIVSVLAIGALASGAVGFIAGLTALGKAPPVALAVTWDLVVLMFLVFWLVGLMVEVQRSESIEISKLLHLPITPSQVFGFNYLVSHLTPSLILIVPGMLGICAGLMIRVSIWFVLLGFVVVAFLFMLTAWTYCLRGWLAALMANKRRRRAVIVWITVGFVGISQLPNLVLNSSWFSSKGKTNRSSRDSFRTPDGQLREEVLKAHLVFPPGWIAYSAVTLKTGSAGPAAGATAAAGLIGLLGLIRAYRLTMRFYRGVESGVVSERQKKPRDKPAGTLLVARALPWVKDDTAALALATFRGFLRAPELKMAFITPLVFLVVFGSLGLKRGSGVPPEYVGVLVATGAVVVACFSFAPTMANTFGLDRDGFRALVLLPTPRHQVLLAKNLAFFPFVLVTAITMLLVAVLVLRAGPGMILPGLVQAPSAFMLFCLVCNTTAILAPYRFSPGTLQAKKPTAVVIIANLLIFVMMPLVALPLALPPGLQLLFSSLGWAGGYLMNVLTATLLLVLIGLFYWRLLPVQGQLLQTRERTVLQAVTEANE